MTDTQFTDNAFSTLDGNITNSATTLDVQTGHGARFPEVNFFIAIYPDDGDFETKKPEVIDIESRSTDTLTVRSGGRGAGDTTAQAWDDGDDIRLVVPAQWFTNRQPSFLASRKASVDDPPDDEFDDTNGMSGESNGIDSKWTVVSGASGTVDMTESGATVERYDLATRPGWLLLQTGENSDQKVELRQDYTIPDGSSIVCALSYAWATYSSGQNESQLGIGINDTDSGRDAGDYHVFYFDCQPGGWRVIVYDGSTTHGATSDNSILNHGLAFFRIDRDGTNFKFYWSTDGFAWTNMADLTISPVPDNLWIWSETMTSGDSPRPIHGVYWIREGGVGLDPWPWLT